MFVFIDLYVSYVGKQQWQENDAFWIFHEEDSSVDCAHVITNGGIVYWRIYASLGLNELDEHRNLFMEI